MCRETAEKLPRMSRFENILPRCRIMLMRESEDTFTKYPKFRNSREHFCMIKLDSKNRTIGYHTASIGSLSTSVVQPREILETCNSGQLGGGRIPA